MYAVKLLVGRRILSAEQVHNKTGLLYIDRLNGSLGSKFAT